MVSLGRCEREWGEGVLTLAQCKPCEKHNPLFFELAAPLCAV